MRILKVIGLLLEYPDELLWENRDDALALIRADVPSLTPFVGELLTAPLLDRQAEWCEVFERGRATSLLLFEHVHAESRDRGQAMVDLMNQYQQAVCRSIVASCPTICRCIWSISVFYLPRRLGRGCRISRRFWR
ncbi:respiratory nitrate reductase subunit delta [Klebsiella pneumoniae]|nr:respiratory nitrate reductase subunit delta [Klebsiella pneumoniae]